MNCDLLQFRVDKMVLDWYGSVSIGAVATLPGGGEPLPFCASLLEPPGVWVVNSEVLRDNGTLVSILFSYIVF